MAKSFCVVRRLSTVLTILLAACSASGSTPAEPATAPIGAATITVTSSAFAEGASIPAKYTCTGSNTSPDLHWTGLPPKTASLALIMDDPDAPSGTFTHWVVYDIPASTQEIAEGAGPAGKEGKNGAGQPGYTGPCPPSGTHRYFFTIYALDLSTLGLPNNAPRAEVDRAMHGHILAEGQLMGRYAR